MYYNQVICNMGNADFWNFIRLSTPAWLFSQIDPAQMSVSYKKTMHGMVKIESRVVRT